MTGILGRMAQLYEWDDKLNAKLNPSFEYNLAPRRFILIYCCTIQNLI